MIFESLQVLRKKWAVQHHQIQEIRAMTRSLGGCSNHIFGSRLCTLWNIFKTTVWVCDGPRKSPRVGWSIFLHNNGGELGKNLAQEMALLKSEFTRPKKWFWIFSLSDESSTNDEELYESIYEVIQPRNIESESDFDEIMEDNGDLEKTPLNKLAEAANKKMRKLRRNWSLKKNDISKSWSRIRKYSTPVIRPTFPVTVNHSNML